VVADHPLNLSLNQKKQRKSKYDISRFQWRWWWYVFCFVLFTDWPVELVLKSKNVYRSILNPQQ
jgi:hypothetical protein